MVVGQPVAVGGGCESGTAFVTVSGESDTRDISQYYIGNGFTPETNLSLYSISANFLNNSGGAVSVELRIDDDVDMSSEYMDSVTVNVPVSDGLTEFVFETPPSLSGSTTYYFIFRASSAVYLYFDSTAPYSGGVYIWTDSSAWNASSTVSDRDVSMVLKECD